jgi:prevent-host-death family protein
MKSVSLEEARAELPKLVREAAAGEVIVICEGGAEVAKIVAPDPPRPVKGPGSLRGLIRMRDDFDDPLPEMEPYTDMTAPP